MPSKVPKKIIKRKIRTCFKVVFLTKKFKENEHDDILEIFF